MAHISKEFIGQQLRRRREYLGFTQADMADKLSMTRTNYSRYESGGTNITAEDLGTIAEILKVPIGYFYGEDEAEGDVLDDDAIMYYNGIREDMKPAAVATLRGLYEQFRANAEGDTIGKKAE